jgi:hypothetical protein
VTALEVAIVDFAKRPKAQEAFGPLLAERLATPSLKAQVEHCGLSGSVRYLLPVIFSPDKLPTQLLKTCQQAVEERGKVIHRGHQILRGQPDVAEDKLRTYLAAIRHVCAILREYQDEDAN